ncbi:AMP-binding protein [Actinoplanes derwentensis]|uniref:Amino acid adenylation domain-containing protein/thioester reductase domain-containing protein n=1 Tax=Actinoplanes derwentensis TaxID=113562 RepID=A0A1H1S0F2_9ACTN|nr:AMP-binding protein [Actinoplanes derwentensis]GID84571.1 hypothetical protein Ade03nite_34950 [Actinoplanes derwentensis]SDS41462.1 amino acid adenylation domain-containing protein/thioester reductase domain-containing protein [Actinoplanes derwentensis]
MLAERVHVHAKRHPTRLAVVSGRDQLTYADLDTRVSRLARCLRERGIGRGALVGIYLDRGVEVIVGLLAALRAGAAYTVIEPSGVVAESAGRLASAAPAIVLTSAAHAAEFSLRVLPTLGPGADGVDAAPPQRPEPAPELDDVAYVLYTSGSTAMPKGVMVSHANLRHYTESLRDALGITEPLHYAHVTTLAADLGNTGLFLALWTGGTLHLVDDLTRRDPAGLLGYLQAERIDVLKTTPSHWAAVSSIVGGPGVARPALRYLLLGGEVLTQTLALRILASGVTGVLINHYGPTEATVGVATYAMRSPADVNALDGFESVPIGTALGSNRLMVQADDGTLQELDAVGELIVAGPSVALGYRVDLESTAAVFGVEDGRRSYRTGDRVRVDARGIIEFLGRADRQVKIGGYRIELPHVEAGLRQLPGVTGAIAFRLERRRPMLVAAVTVADLAFGRDDQRGALAVLLPPYMIPDRIEILAEFPRTANGKTDANAVRRLVEERLAAPETSERNNGDPVLADVRAVWRRYLGHDAFGNDDDFSAIGGSSLDAIQVIGDLQNLGYRVSASVFFGNATPAALAAEMAITADGETDAALHGPAVSGTVLSPAQQWFFAQRFAQPDRWNQAILLDIAPEVRPAELAAAIRDTVERHPMLRTAFRVTPQPERVEVAPSFELTESALPDEDDATTAHIRATAAARQDELRLADGSVFKAHLFRGDRTAHLLLIGHHLCVDAVSWRIMVDDICRGYRARLAGTGPATGPVGVDMGTWAAHLHEHAPDLWADLTAWKGVERSRAAVTAGDDNLERDASAVWWAMSRAETDALTRAAAASGTTAHVALLGAFAHALAVCGGQHEMVIDVESHGRISFDDRIDVSLLVGWLTSTFPVRVDVVADDPRAAVKSAAAALDGVPNLGVAYALHRRPRRAAVCFNHLGAFTLPYDDPLRPRLSRYPIGPVRGPANDRTYDLKLTSRLHDGHLVVEQSYSSRRHSDDEMRRLAGTTRALLLEVSGSSERPARLVIERESTVGLLAQVPRELDLAPPARVRREYGAVLLTGATGFIGAHLLHLLLTRTSGRIYCLVRDAGGQPAAERLRQAYDWYALGPGLDSYADRVTVLAADLTEPDLGLTASQYRRLSREVEAIYHLAAETRLFGDRDTFTRQNTRPVAELIRLAGTGQPKDLHHLSTLAVCGRGGRDRPVAFTEHDLDVGQEFLNEYERSKFDAERLVHDFAAHGGAGFVYRTGNVTGHSVTGRFQRNAGDNRMVQLLRAAVAIGRVPEAHGHHVALSPVDMVAMGVLEISRSERVRSGTFHVDIVHAVSYSDIFAALRDLGCAIEPDCAADFTTLFEPYLATGDEALRLAHFWAARPARNVRYDHAWTRRLLDELQVRFPAPTGRWLRVYFGGLIERGYIDVERRGPRYG